MRLFWNLRRLSVCCRRLLVAALAIVVFVLLVTTVLPSAVAARGRGDIACDLDAHRYLKEKDVISEKFMKDHICLIRKSAPTDLEAFCRDFRQGPRKYQVMLLNSVGIKQLRQELSRHQTDFDKDRENFRPLRRNESSVHYTTDNAYTFIYCELTKKWKGQHRSNEYHRYASTCI